jgi:MFS family permease
MSRLRTEAPILVALFLDLMGFGMILADFQLRGEAMMPKGWPTGLIIGSLLASTFVVQVIVSPYWGNLSDHIGRKPVLVACSILSAAGMLVYGLAGSVALLLVSRILAGFGGANVAIAQAYVGDLDDVSTHARAIGRIGAATTGGLVIGPVIGGIFAQMGANHLVGYSACLASGFGALMIAVLLHHRPRGEAPAISRHGPGWRLLREFPQLRGFFLIAAISWFSVAMLEGTFARLIHQLYGYDQRQFGLLFGYEALLGVIVQGIVLSWVVKYVKSIPLLRFAYITQGFGLALNPFAGIVAVPLVLLFIASTFFALGSSLANPTITAKCGALVTVERRGELFGLMQGARSVGFLVGPMLGGMLFDFRPAVPYLLAGAICVVAAALVPGDRHSQASA